MPKLSDSFRIWANNKWLKANKLSIINYHTRAIIRRGLYIFYLISKDHFFVFKEVFSENSVIMYGLYSRAAYVGACTVNKGNVLYEKLYMKLYLNGLKNHVGFWGHQDILWGSKNLCANLVQQDTTVVASFGLIFTQFNHHYQISSSTDHYKTN